MPSTPVAPPKRSLARRLRLAMVVFFLTSGFELGLVGASSISASNIEGQAASDFRIQQAYLFVQVARTTEEGIETSPQTTTSALVAAQTNVNRGLSELRETAVQANRPDITAGVDSLSGQVGVWRKSYVSHLTASDQSGDLTNDRTTQAVPVTLVGTWTRLQTVIDQQLEDDFSNLQDVRHRLVAIALAAGVLGLTIGTATLVLAQRSVMRPLLSLRVLALKMSRGEPIDPDLQSIAGARELEDVHRALVSAAVKMHKQADALADASEAKTTFIGYLSHELRTPLNAILGMTGSLQMDPDLSTSQHSALTTIKTAGDHLLAVINDVLDLARVEAGQVSLNVEVVRIADVVSGALEVVRPIIDRGGVTLQENIDPRAYITADRRRTVQVLINLVSNAIKYGGEHGDVIVAASVQPANTWRLSVIDHGPGIPPETLAKLFQAFERGGADRSSVEGTGLGLVLSKRLVEAMNGRIGVTSAEGAGTAFWIELPMAFVSEDDPAPPAGQLPPQQPGQGGAIPPDLMDLLRVK